MTDSHSVDRCCTNLQGEFDSAGVYHALAEAEPDAHLREVPKGSELEPTTTANNFAPEI